ncbi:LOW QUALITY PROTEIN: Nucleoporin [Phytophthora megakarya]|uniref:Nucleoporin n=1 Tax=Phytophthora megakarya TaxID=4795 RepID=A0A225X085_9STRA|nr:LOW QUALITY PROTEIN: Nucleoporin [Phytophthora megakarya]
MPGEFRHWSTSGTRTKPACGRWNRHTRSSARSWPPAPSTAPCLCGRTGLVPQRLAQLVDARDSVHDVKFAPRHLGLRLATASEDGFVRMYEEIDVINLSHWPLQEEFLADKGGVTCVSWNKSRFDVPKIVVGGNSNVAKVWGYNNSYRLQVLAELVGHADAIHDVCWAPNMDRSSRLLAPASKDHTVRIWRLTIQEDDHL